MGEIEEEYDYQLEIEPDKHTLNENMNRSRYFFAMISFLIALIILGIFFNNYYDVLSGWLLLAGVFAFGVIGVFFLLSNTRMIHSTSIQRDYQGNVVGNTFLEVEKEERSEVVKDSYRDELSPFEQLVREALATIPTEFHEQMENVLVRQPRRWLPEGYENYESLLAAAVEAAINHPEVPQDLTQWRWGRFAPIDIEHPVLGRLPLIGRWTAPGLHDQSGGGLTVKQVGRAFGPSERYTADLSDFDQSTLNTVTGQGGNLLSPYYMDQWKAWYEGTTLALPFSKEAVEKAKTHELVLEPGQ